MVYDMLVNDKYEAEHLSDADVKENYFCEECAKGSLTYAPLQFHNVIFFEDMGEHDEWIYCDDCFKKYVLGE